MTENLEKIVFTLFIIIKRKKRQCERKYLTTKLEIHRQIYHKQCNNYLLQINLAKSNYYKNLIKESDHCQLFNLVNGLLCVQKEPALP